MIAAPWLWIPLTLFAAAAADRAQHRAAAADRRSWARSAPPLVRFFYGMPILVLWLAGVVIAGSHALPALTADFAVWIAVAALGQMAGTALLLRAMAARSFAIGLVYSKSEVLQVALFSVIFLGETLSLTTALAIVLATLGVVLLSRRGDAALPRSGRSWADPAALFGLASGTGFAISVVGYRGAALALRIDLALSRRGRDRAVLEPASHRPCFSSPAAARAYARCRAGRAARMRGISLFAGIAGASASIANVTAALALEPARRHVRTLILIEVLFTYVVSFSRIFRGDDQPARSSLGIVLVVLGACGGSIVATAR